jgi:hypothetical protein
MAPRLLIAAGVIVYAVVIPFLEINASHVFNSEWPAHARFHEVWQLITNSTIGILAMWLAFRKNAVRIASILNIIVMGSALMAHAIEGAYSGSIVSGNIEKTILGMELAAFSACVVLTLAVTAFALESRQLVVRAKEGDIS